MNKRVFRLSLISVLLTPIFSNLVFAQEGKAVDILNKFGEFLFVQVAGLEAYAFKFVIWILLFALFQFGLKKVFSEGKTAGILSFFLSFGSVLAMPNSWAMKIFTTYGNVIAIALALLAPMLGFWLNHSWFNEDSKFHHIMGGVIYILIGFSFGSVLETLGDIVSRASNTGTAELITSFAYFGMYLCYFMGAWKIIQSIAGAHEGGWGRKLGEKYNDYKEEKAEEAKENEDADDALKKLAAIESKERKIGRKLRRAGKASDKTTGKIIKGLNLLKKMINKARLDPDIRNVVKGYARKVFTPVNKEMDSVHDFNENIEDLKKWNEGEIAELRKRKSQIEAEKATIPNADSQLRIIDQLIRESAAKASQLDDVEKLVKSVEDSDENVKAALESVMSNLDMGTDSGYSEAIVEVDKAIKEMESIDKKIPTIREYVKRTQALILNARKIIKADLKKQTKKEGNMIDKLKDRFLRKKGEGAYVSDEDKDKTLNMLKALLNEIYRGQSNVYETIDKFRDSWRAFLSLDATKNLRNSNAAFNKELDELEKMIPEENIRNVMTEQEIIDNRIRPLMRRLGKIINSI